MIRLVIVVAVVLAAVVVAWFAQQRRPTAPTNPELAEAPAQLNRGEFPRPEAPWLVVVFSSATCESCAAVRSRADLLASDDVAVFDCEVSAEAGLHRRYHITAVPTTVICDRDGVVQRSFIGPVSSTHLWGAVAELREPGSTGTCSPGDH